MCETVSTDDDVLDNDESHDVDDPLRNVAYGGVAWDDNIYPGHGGGYGAEPLKACDDAFQFRYKLSHQEHPQGSRQ